MILAVRYIRRYIRTFKHSRGLKANLKMRNLHSSNPNNNLWSHKFEYWITIHTDNIILLAAFGLSIWARQRIAEDRKGTNRNEKKREEKEHGSGTVENTAVGRQRGSWIERSVLSIERVRLNKFIEFSFRLVCANGLFEENSFFEFFNYL